MALNLIKQQALNGNPKAIQQINYIGKLDQAGKKQCLFLIEEAKEIILGF